MNKDFKYFKRISDFQPLGKPIDGNWNNIEPIKLQYISHYNGSYTPSTITSDTFTKNTGDNPIAYQLQGTPSEKLVGIVDAFSNSKVRRSQTSSQIVKTDAYINIDGNPVDVNIDSEYYLPALWFEVSILKNSANRPVPIDINSSTIPAGCKYQNRKLNAFNMICDPTKFDTITESENEKHLVTSKYIADFLEISELYANTIETGYAEFNSIHTTNITANYIGINTNISNSESTIETNRTNTTAISANTVQSLIPYLYGTNFYFPNVVLNQNKFDVKNIFANTGYFKNLHTETLKTKNIIGDISDKNPEIKNTGIHDYGIVDSSSSGIACYFIADTRNGLSSGDLVRLGKYTDSPEETEIIKLTTTSSIHNVLGIVLSDEAFYPGIILNKKLKKSRPNDDKIKLVHIFGYIEKVKIHGPIKMHNLYESGETEHHKAGWELTGCCTQNVDSKDKGVGAPLYLYNNHSYFTTEIDQSIDNQQIALLVEPTDNGSNINHTFLEFTRLYEDYVNIPADEKTIGGRQAAAYFVSKI